MGSLDATVLCNCVQDKTLKQPKKYDQMYQQIKQGQFNEDNLTPEKTQLYRDYEHWRETCCDHEGMWEIAIGIGRNSLMGRFAATMRSLADAETANTILKAIPHIDGITSYQHAEKLFSQLNKIKQQDVLIGEDLIILENLTKVCQASIKTKNYVYWG